MQADTGGIVLNSNGVFCLDSHPQWKRWHMISSTFRWLWYNNIDSMRDNRYQHSLTPLPLVIEKMPCWCCNTHCGDVERKLYGWQLHNGDLCAVKWTFYTDWGPWISETCYLHHHLIQRIYRLTLIKFPKRSFCTYDIYVSCIIQACNHGSLSLQWLIYRFQKTKLLKTFPNKTRIFDPWTVMEKS